MAQEIERKFLVDRARLALPDEGLLIRQAYIKTIDLTVVRLRIRGDQGFLTIKGANTGISRSEFEYPVPIEDAQAMIDDLCHGPVISKRRYLIEHAGWQWEVDVFDGDNHGLIVAEIELPAENTEFALPEWVTEEVSGDPRYYNSSLLDNPYSQWKEQG